MSSANTWLHEFLGECSVHRASHDELDERSAYVVQAGNERYLLKRYQETGRLQRDVAGSTIARSSAGIRTPRVIATRADEGLVLFEFIPGITLGKLLSSDQSPSAFKEKVITHVGRVTKQLHHVDVASIASLPVLSLAEELRDQLACLQTVHDSLQHFARETPGQDRIVACDVIGKLLQSASEAGWNDCDVGDLTQKAVVHGDLWSANIVVAGSDVALVDFEWSCVCDPMTDLARIYSRGLVARDLSREYAITPPKRLWQEFQNGYGMTIDDRDLHFRAALLFGLLRTINHYAARLQAHRGSGATEAAIRAIVRIGSAIDEYLSRG